MALTITQLEKKGVTLLELGGKLIFGEECDAFNQQIKDLQDADKNKIILKLEQVSICDSSGLGNMLTALGTVTARGGDMKLLKPSEKVQALLDLTKLNTVFDIHTDEGKAVASFK